MMVALSSELNTMPPSCAQVLETLETLESTECGCSILICLLGGDCGLILICLLGGDCCTILICFLGGYCGSILNSKIVWTFFTKAFKRQDTRNFKATLR